MAEFDKESDSQRDLTYDLYDKTAKKRPRILAPASGLAVAYAAVFTDLYKEQPAGKNFIPKIIAKLVIGATIGYTSTIFVERQLCKKYKKKMLTVEEYIKLHPEQFVEQDPRKFKDIILPWMPYR